MPVSRLLRRFPSALSTTTDGIPQMTRSLNPRFSPTQRPTDKRRPETRLGPAVLHRTILRSPNNITNLRQKSAGEPNCINTKWPLSTPRREPAVVVAATLARPSLRIFLRKAATPLTRQHCFRHCRRRMVAALPLRAIILDLHLASRV